MTQEHVDLLTKELSARVPYGVKIKTDFFQTATLISIRKNISLNSGKELSVTYDISGKDEPFQMEERWGTPISEIKPYLIPLSCMTEEQYDEMEKMVLNDYTDHMRITNELREKVDFITHWPLYSPDVIDWFHRNHFDYRGLIEMGLVLKAPDGMYNQNI